MAKLNQTQLRALEGRADPPHLGALAEDYAAKGYTVFPLVPGGKKPLTHNGFKDATTDVGQIRSWWQRNPKANVGIPYLLAVDLDVKHGEDGPGNWAALVESEGLDLPDPVVVRTASGGEHHLYSDPTGSVTNKAGLVPGVDVRGNNGYVVAPGSVVGGSVYRVEGADGLPVKSELPVAPEALRSLLNSRKPQPNASGTTSAPTGGSLGELLAEPPTEGSRNEWLARVAGHYARSLAWEDYCDHVERANRHCQPPLKPAELGTLQISIWEREQAKTDPESDAHQRMVAEEAQRIRVRRDAQRLVAKDDELVDESGLFVGGGEFMFDIPEGTPAVWGDGDQVLWAEGEALMIAGPTGVGKTTLSGQVIRARLGLGGLVLGLPVAPTRSRVLYLAMDRPAQIARSLRRHFDPSEREVVDRLLTVRKGPPPKDVAQYPPILMELAQSVDADTIVVDSVKDAAVGLSSDEVGSGYNRALQLLTANGVEVLELHHLRKQGSDGNKPNDLNGVYGSAWLTGGIGSLILLWGEAGDLDVEMVHLKHPADRVGPWRLHHDHASGTTSRIDGGDPLSLLIASPDGLSRSELAEAMGWDPAEKRDKNRAQRELMRLASSGLATSAMERRGTQKTTVWRADAQAAGRLL